MSIKRITGISLFLISLVFLVFGLSSAFLTFRIQIDAGGGGMSGFLGGLLGGMMSDMNKTITYNIPETMKMLFENEKYFVGVLIGFFAVFIPVVKTILSIIYLFNSKSRLLKLIQIIGKFAMADVFCVGVCVAFLYTQANQVIKVDIEQGFYWFTAYVLTNILAMIFIEKKSES